MNQVFNNTQGGGWGWGLVKNECSEALEIETQEVNKESKMQDIEYECLVIWEARFRDFYFKNCVRMFPVAMTKYLGLSNV
jgi:hypothetical protein